MDDELELNGLHIAPEVVETIVIMAVGSIESVAALGSAKAEGNGIKQRNQRQARKAVVVTSEDDKLVVDVHVTVHFGYHLRDIASEIREVVDSAVETQLGIQVSAVNVFVDGLKFED